jgi:hypothetical protein
MSRLAGVLVAAALIGVAAPREAAADDNDLVLSRFGTPVMVGGQPDVVPDNQKFRSLVSQLGVAMAPNLNSASDSLGFSGFQFSTELGYVTIDSSKDYWCATEESANCNPGFERSGSLKTIGVMARKGIWLPLPSFEVGAGAVHLIGSRMWTGQVYSKFSVLENWLIPVAFSARGAASRLFGSEQLDLTVASFDLSFGGSFGVGSTVNLAPYLGWNYLWIVPRSEVIDATPRVSSVDPDGANNNDILNNFVFPDQDNITRTRVYGGVKVKYYVFALTAEVNFALAGDSVDDRASTTTDCADLPPDRRNNCDATDQASSQTSIYVTVSMDL